MEDAAASGEGPSLLTVPLELHGNWGASPIGDVAAVIERIRKACLVGIRLRSDRQPTALRVDNHLDGTPAVWLHFDGTSVACIIVDIGELAWCQLAYQFGHELGHVLCNSWQDDAKPGLPSHWMEEALVETLSIYGLARLADGWARNPPFPDDQAYADAIRTYRRTLLDEANRLAVGQGASGADLKGWFRAHRDGLDHGGLGAARPAIPALLTVYENDATCIADLGALNRWPQRDGVDIGGYLQLWVASCREIGTPGLLPRWFAKTLGINIVPS